MGWNTNRVRATLAVIALTVATGCTTEQPAPKPEPEPGPRYERPPHDLCDRLRTEQIATQVDLVLPPGYEPATDYHDEPGYQRVSCRFAGQAEDGRLATELQDFDPSGYSYIEVYNDLARAERSYQNDHRMYQRFEGNQDNATAAEETGWWDRGASLEWVRVLDPDDYVLDDFEISRLDVSQAALHGNLVVTVSLWALAPTDETAEALAVLREIAAALVDETVEHLTRTGD